MKTIVGKFWIIFPIFFLLPVLIVFLQHNKDYTDEYIFQTENISFFTGRESLDSLLHEFRGKIVMVNFWAVWCTPCVGELPRLDSINRRYSQHVSVIAVDIGDPDKSVVLQLVEDLSLGLPVIWLSEQEATLLKDEWNLPDVLPVTLLLDRDGVEVTRLAGSRSLEEFEIAVQDISGELFSGFANDSQYVDTSIVSEIDRNLHINVVGLESDPGTSALMLTAIELAGEDGVDYYNPSLPQDSILIMEAGLPFMEMSYAQPCIGTMCGRPAVNPDELVEISRQLQEM